MMDSKQQEIGNVDDLSALAWVHDELRRSIETAHKALRRFVRESEAVTQSDIDAVDPTILRTARSNLHQGVGALELVGLSAAAQTLRASENAVQKLTARSNRLSHEACDAIERSSFGLLDYLARMLAGKPVSPVALFPQYLVVQELAGADRIHPADLWPHDWRWRDVPPTSDVARRPGEDTQSAIETNTLMLMRQPEGPAAATLAQIYSGLANGVIADGHDRRIATLWQLGAAFFEAQSHGMLPLDVYTKRMASRLMAQWRMVGREGADVSQAVDASDRLAQDLLFFCAQAGSPGPERHAQRLAAVRQAWGLVGAAPISYAATQLGRFDPTWVAQAKKRVVAAKDTWSGIAADEKHRLQGLVEQFHLVGESLVKLYPAGDALAKSLQEAAATTIEHDQVPSPAFAMEVATALLYIEASLDDADFDNPSQANRVKRLADRIQDARTGQAQQDLDPWMEELYRRVADRQTMGSVVQELRTALGESEKAIDQYFRDTSKRELLMPVPGQLQAMRGVMSVLGLEQASQTVVRMRDDVEPLLAGLVSPDEATEQGVFDRMAGNLGALGFLIDMLSVQPQMAKSLFKFDSATGTLQSVVRRKAGDREGSRDSGFGRMDAGPNTASPQLVNQVEALALTAAHPEVSNESVARDLQRLSQEAYVSDQPVLAETMASVHTALTEAKSADEQKAVRDELAQAMADFVSSTSEATRLQPELAPLPTAMVPLSSSKATPAGETGLEADEEMRAIFLEEAREVIDAAGQALTALERKPDDVGEFTNVRRAFHTLKGSSRMVGLKDFGEAGWAFEQLYNARLADQANLDADLAGFTREGLVYMGDWVNAIEALRHGGHDSNVVRHAADAMRLHGKREVLALPSAPQLSAEPPKAAMAPAAKLQVPAPVARMDADPMAAVRSSEESFNAVSRPMTLGKDDGLAGGQFDVNPRVVGSRASHATAFDATQLDSLPQPSMRGGAGSKPMVAPPPAEPTSKSAAVAFTAAGLAAGAAAAAMKPFTVGFNELPATAGDAPRAKTAAVPATPAVEQGAEDHGFADTHPALTAAEAAELEAMQAAQDRQAALPTLEKITLDESRTEPARDSAASIAAPAPTKTPTPTETPTQTPATAFSAEPVEARAPDNVKVIGNLQVAIPLFNIFLSEADEKSRLLEVAVAEWQHGLQGAVGAEAEAHAHSLAGSSSTVGYTALSQLARAVEHALGRCNQRGHGDAAEAQLFVDAAEEIRKLLHQFAAGFLRDPQLALLKRLETHEANASLARSFSLDSQLAPLAADAVVMPSASPVPAAHGSAPVASAVPASVLAPAAASLPAVAVHEARPSVRTMDATTRVGDLDVLDDDIDSVDSIDEELFPIFEEEGLELFPKLSTHMRDWVSNPSLGDGANACLRSLHTIKGGARLAGAMRLGEMAHRLESSIETLVARGDATVEEVEALQVRVDHLGATFDTLRGQDRGASPAMQDDDAWGSSATTGSTSEPLMPLPLPMVSEATTTGQAAAGFGPSTHAAELDPAALAPAELVPAAPRIALPLRASTTQAAPLDEPAPSVQAERADATPAATVAATPTPSKLAAMDGMRLPSAVNWSRFPKQGAVAAAVQSAFSNATSVGTVRVKSALLDRLVNHAGEVSITRSRIDADVAQLKGAITDLTDNLDRMRNQLREIEVQAESQISSRLEAAKVVGHGFDPLEMDRFTRFQELTRMLAESVNDVATVHRGLQRTVQSTEDQLAAQARLTRDLQDNLLRTRMVEFDSLSDRLYRVVRQAAKETGKQVRLDIVNGTIEVDRGVLDRMVGAFEHLLRNCITHGVELPDVRVAAGKEAAGTVTITLHQEGNEVAIEIRDDGAGLNFGLIRERAVARGLMAADANPTEAELAPLIFTPGFTTATQVTELAGRGVGMDVVRNEVNALGGRVETSSVTGLGATFKLVVPLTTAVTQVVMLRAGELILAMPSTLVEIVKRVNVDECNAGYATGRLGVGESSLPFYWLGALLQHSERGAATEDRSLPVVVVRSAQQRIALHVDEVLGNQEVVVKNLGPQMSRLPGLAGITLLPSGQVVLIYNPVALASLYGAQVHAAQAARLASAKALAATGAVTDASAAQALNGGAVKAALAPLVLVVDDSLTVRRVTQRMLQREGYRVALAKDGLDGLEKLAEERPAVLLSDIEMPRMDGFDLVRNLRGDSRWRDLPVIMITSRIAQKHKDHAATLGVNHYLGKPYAEDELLQLIGQFISDASAKQGAAQKLAS
jgi:chemosensory pili system protein ChpA (sensor histidine kinase/response regulator)